MNQTQAVRDYLVAGNGLTSLEAIQKFGCTRLSAKIFDLRKKGYAIESEPVDVYDRYGKRTQVSRYKCVKTPEERGLLNGKKRKERN